jgi:hypothetical protein
MMHISFLVISVSVGAKWVDEFRFLGPFRYFLFLYLILFNLWKKIPSPRINKFEFKSGGSKCEVECQVLEINGNLGRCHGCIHHMDSIKDEQAAEHWEHLKMANLESMELFP